jgi:HSP20 family protein
MENTQMLPHPQNATADGRSPAQDSTLESLIFAPATDIFEGENEWKILADVPGVDERNLSVTLEGNVLTLEGKIPREPMDGYELTFSEYREGDYRRTFTLAEGIDRDRIAASLKNGLVELTLPKAETTRVKRIPVKSA